LPDVDRVDDRAGLFAEEGEGGAVAREGRELCFDLARDDCADPIAPSSARRRETTSRALDSVM